MKPPSWSALLGRNARLVGDALKPLRERHRAPAGAGSWLMGLVMASDGPRRYYLFRPEGVRFGERLPLLVMLHGCHGCQGCWNWFDTRSGRAIAEAAWIMQAVDQACVLYAADRERVAVAGLSAGASMAALLATRYPQRFKAVAMHSGVPPGAAHSTASAVGAMQGRRAPPEPGEADGRDWPPLMVIHGDEDGIVSARNAGAAVTMWSRAAGAQPEAPRELQRGKRYPMRVTQFRRVGRLVATLVQVGQLGHAWSGGAARQRFSDARGPDASRMVWRFAARQFDALSEPLRR